MITQKREQGNIAFEKEIPGSACQKALNVHVQALAVDGFNPFVVLGN